MKSKLILSLIAAGLLFVAGCDDDDCFFDPVPATPQGVYSITGDRAVYLYWYGPYERDIVEYIVWRSDQPVHGYTEIGRRDAVSNKDLDLIIYEYVDDNVQNGETYYYAVSSVDRAGHVSELSAEDVFDTPRPDGQVVLFDAAIEPSLAGYRFADSAMVDSSESDVFVDRFNGTYYINAANLATDIQDMGHTESFDDIGWAPVEGWSDIGWFEIILHHTYVIWTSNLRFAKMRVESINQNSVTFRWAYQTVQNNRELVAGPEGLEKPSHGPEYLQKTTSSSSVR